jgi:cytochrome c
MAPSRVVLAFITAATMICLSGCNDEGQHIAEVTTGGNVHRGAAAIERYGCGSCHVIPGISGAQGRVGASLDGIADRIYIAGVLQNTPENMVRWIRNPKAVDEKTIMPNLGVTQRDAADIAGYLYTLK